MQIQSLGDMQVPIVFHDVTHYEATNSKYKMPICTSLKYYTIITPILSRAL